MILLQQMKSWSISNISELQSYIVNKINLLESIFFFLGMANDKLWAIWHFLGFVERIKEEDITLNKS